MQNTVKQLSLLGLSALAIASTAEAVCVNPTLFTDSGADAAAIAGTVNQFSDALGPPNPFEPGSVGTGRRSINWDAAPDGVSAPNDFAGDFFNADFSPRARGIEFTSPGDGFQLSATQASGVGIEFDNINQSYSDEFTVFSAERLFTAIDSTIVNARFFVAGENTPAISSGFGAVFTDVDINGSTSLEFFNEVGDSFATFDVPSNPSGLSFVGVTYDAPCISQVKITSGNTPVGVDESNGLDIVVMDDFIFGEPNENPDAPPFSMNLGLVGAWFNPATAGQGFLFDLLTDERQFFFLTWFTFADGGEQQWFTAGGNFEGNSATLNLVEATDGVFNQPDEVTRTVVGTVTASFTDCLNGTVEFDIPDRDVNGVIPITRIAGDQICQSILDGDLVIPNEVAQ